MAVDALAGCITKPSTAMQDKQVLVLCQEGFHFLCAITVLGNDRDGNVFHVVLKEFSTIQRFCCDLHHSYSCSSKCLWKHHLLGWTVAHNHGNEMMRWCDVMMWCDVMWYEDASWCDVRYDAVNGHVCSCNMSLHELTHCPWDECHLIPFMIRQHWLRQWLGAWANVDQISVAIWCHVNDDQGPWCHVASPGHNELKLSLSLYTVKTDAYIINIYVNISQVHSQLQCMWLPRKPSAFLSTPWAVNVVYW